MSGDRVRVVMGCGLGVVLIGCDDVMGSFCPTCMYVMK